MPDNLSFINSAHRNSLHFNRDIRVVKDIYTITNSGSGPDLHSSVFLK